MIDRLVHHAEILSLKGDSYRLRDKDLGSPPPRDERSRLLRLALRARLRRRDVGTQRDHFPVVR